MPALALPADDRHDDLGAVDHPAEVDRERLVPVVESSDRRGAAAVDPGVVAQHVDLAECLERLRRGGAQALALGDVGLDEMHRVVAASCSFALAMCSSFQSASETFIPSSRNARAMPRPMPLAPPVMKATLPVRSSIEPSLPVCCHSTSRLVVPAKAGTSCK